jgi:hypothetical protein
MTLPIAGASVFQVPRLRQGMPAFIMAVLLIFLFVLVVVPVILILMTSIMVQPEVFVGDRLWGLANWRAVFDDPTIFRALWNTFLVWGLTMAISMPVSVVIAWTLARTKLPCSPALEFMFWVAYITPGGVIAWILLIDPQIGIVNVMIRSVFTGLTEGPFNVFSLGASNGQWHSSQGDAADPGVPQYGFQPGGSLARQRLIECTHDVAGDSAPDGRAHHSGLCSAAGPDLSVLRDRAAIGHALGLLRLFDPDLRSGAQYGTAALRRGVGASEPDPINYRRGDSVSALDPRAQELHHHYRHL